MPAVFCIYTRGSCHDVQRGRQSAEFKGKAGCCQKLAAPGFFQFKSQSLRTAALL